MKITLIVPESGYAFINQARALVRGFIALGHEARVAREPIAGSVAIAVGSWVHYRELVEGPRSAGFRVVPWLVSDDRVDGFIDELNTLPLLLTPSKHGQSIFFRDGITTKIEVIPEAVDDGFWKPQTAEEVRPIAEFLSIREDGLDMPQKFDLSKLKSDGVPILFTTGGDATSKGAQEVLRALDPALPWIYLIKTWPGVESLKKSADELELASQLGIADRIRYVVGEYSREFVRGLMNLCDIYVSPSRSEGFGLPLVEAQLCGKPVIGSDQNASGETILDGKTGFVVNSDSIQLKEALTKLIFDPSLRKKLGDQARLHAHNTYNPKKIAQRFLDLGLRT